MRMRASPAPAPNPGFGATQHNFIGAPLKIAGYTPAQAAKAVVAALTCAIALLGLAVTSFTEGPLAVVGGWAAAALLVVTPIAVFVKSAEPIIDALDGDDEGPAAV